MSGLQYPNRLTGPNLLADRDQRTDRFVGGPQRGTVPNRDDPAIVQPAGISHHTGAGCSYFGARAGRQIDTPVTGAPALRRRPERDQDPRRRGDR